MFEFTKEYAMLCQRSAEAWAYEYSKNDQYKWHAEWAWKRADEAWAGYYDSK